MHQLALPPADFTGREQTLVDLQEGVALGGVLLSGGQGVGKTTLALKLAAQVVAHYPDAQLYVDLRGANATPLTSTQVMAHVLRAYRPLDRLPEGLADLRALCRSVLREQRTIIVLDNVAGVEQIAPLLGLSSCALLVTSQDHLSLPDLRAVRLDPLPTSDARALLLKIAPRVKSHAEAIAAACGGLPWALRLAGGVLAESELDPAAYLQRLEEKRDRLGTIEGALSVSYGVLGEQLRRHWCLLSILGNFDRHAAASIWALDASRAQDVLDELVQRGLLEWHRRVARYKMHDLARPFAAARLGQAERAAGRRRQAVHYVDVLRAIEGLVGQGAEGSALGLALFDQERTNIEAGQVWAALHAETEDAAARLCSAYAAAGAVCLDLRMRAQDRHIWLHAGLKAALRLGDLSAQGRHLADLGDVRLAIGQAEHAIECYQGALTRYQQTGDRRSECVMLDKLADAHRVLGRVGRTIACLEQALDIAHELDDRNGQSAYLDSLGNAYAARGQVERAIEYYRRALAVARENGDRCGESTVLGNLGNAYGVLRQAKRAIECYQGALVISRELGDQGGKGVDLGSLGNAYHAAGQFEQAVECYRSALVIAREIGDLEGESAALGNLGVVYRAMGEVERAIECYEQSLRIDRDLDDRRSEAADCINLGNVYRDLRRFDWALEYFQRALVLSRELDDREGEGVALASLGNTYYVMGQIDQACERVEAALQAFDAAGSPQAIEMRALLAGWRAQSGQRWWQFWRG